MREEDEGVECSVVSGESSSRGSERVSYLRLRSGLN